MSGVFGKFVSVVGACALAFALVPAAPHAYGADASDDAGADGALLDADRAAAIDADAGSFAADQMIVVLKSGADEGAATAAMTAQSVDTSSEVLAGGDAEASPTVLKVSLPEGSSVGEAVVAAEKDDAVAYAQPNYRYTLLDDGADGVTAAGEGTSSGDAASGEPLRKRRWPAHPQATTRRRRRARTVLSA